MDRGPLNYCRWGIIKRRICVENVPGEVMLGNLMDRVSKKGIRDS